MTELLANENVRTLIKIAAVAVLYLAVYLRLYRVARAQEKAAERLERPTAVHHLHTRGS